VDVIKEAFREVFETLGVSASVILSLGTPVGKSIHCGEEV
jgi:hypothetical protein